MLFAGACHAHLTPPAKKTWAETSPPDEVACRCLSNRVFTGAVRQVWDWHSSCVSAGHGLALSERLIMVRPGIPSATATRAGCPFTRGAAKVTRKCTCICSRTGRSGNEVLAPGKIGPSSSCQCEPSRPLGWGSEADRWNEFSRQAAWSCPRVAPVLDSVLTMGATAEGWVRCW